jgi:Beta-lactamase enzyme family
VTRQPRIKLNNPYQRIEELETKLDRAIKYIRRLRRHNNELQRQLAYFEDRYRQQSTPVEREVVVMPQPKPRRRRRKPPAKGAEFPRIDTAKGFSLRRKRIRWAQLRLAAVAIGLTALSLLTVSWVVRSLFRPPATEQTTSAAAAVTTTSAPQLPALPLVPPEYPSAQGGALPTLSTDLDPQNLQPTYNVSTPPNLKPSKDLQAIVDELVNKAVDQGRPTDKLSITLINVKSGEIAGYQQQELRFPASVLKMFWMVYVYGGLAEGILPDEAGFNVDLFRMIQQSSNDSASRIIDAVTGTKSGEKLSDEEYQNWKQRRMFLTEFFRKAGYDGIILSQKTLSTSDRPKGRDGQMWDDSPEPIRNRISSEHAARLMYEIVTGKAISPESSQKMLTWLARDLSPEGKEDTTRFGGFNPIKGFFGEPLPEDIDFASKAGWTSSGRHEVAFVRTRDGKTAYILSVLASDESYSNDWHLFPDMSRFVFQRLGGS